MPPLRDKVVLHPTADLVIQRLSYFEIQSPPEGHHAHV